MVWKLEYSRTAVRQLKKLDRQTARQLLDYMDKRISSVEDLRTTGKLLSGPLGGLWRYRVGDYRVICEIQDETVCILVLQLGNRRDVYR